MSRVGEERLLAFDFGLNGLRRVTDLPTLPEDAAPPARETEPALHLEALFEVTSLDDSLQAMSVPDISDPKVLEPPIYTAALDDACEALRRHSAMGGPDAEIFARALAVVEAAQADRTLLLAAQRALMRA